MLIVLLVSGYREGCENTRLFPWPLEPACAMYAACEGDCRIAVVQNVGLIRCYAPPAIQ